MRRPYAVAHGSVNMIVPIGNSLLRAMELRLGRARCLFDFGAATGEDMRGSFRTVLAVTLIALGAAGGPSAQEASDKQTPVRTDSRRFLPPGRRKLRRSLP